MMTKAIIPCCGYGTRMGMKPNESKEMLIDPNYDGEDPEGNGRLIDFSLNLCYKYNIEPVVISRVEKEDLNAKLRCDGVEHIVCKPGKEWAETVLKSQGLWGDKNILILPDTRFNIDAVPKVLDKVDFYTNIVLAVHKINPEEANKWGTVGDGYIHEKQPSNLDKAWGLIGFNKSVFSGEWLFQSLKPKESLWIGKETPLVGLDYFLDITRSGTLERY